ncbi:MAG TPA: DUF933 domain-containing protein [Syntrophorhabdaceae bacterium]|nr:DUF933 domain-containing protein [Syntrophorhabdaceae bacterium]HPU30109.1 DUF933 domain-containing protein [Syntrophorhabdaceae bacterium]
MHIAIIGKNNVGKTTIFKALTGLGEESKQASHISIIDVPDYRLENLSNFFKAKKTVYARIEIEDTPSLNPDIFQRIRQADAFILILPYFEDTEKEPVQEYRSVINEFILSDMAQVEQRLERIAKQGERKENPMLQYENEMLKLCLSHLNEERPLLTLAISEDGKRIIRGFQFLSQKPLMVIINCSEDKLSDVNNIEKAFKDKIEEDIPCIAVCASLEAEIGIMNENDRKDFMTEYSIKEAIRERMIRLATETMGLITFFTVGEKECHAWHLRKGESVHEAARTIHTDFYNKFIRAEVVAYEDFIKYNGFGGCKKAGVWRLEGKTYIVQDGDIITIRAGA